MKVLSIQQPWAWALSTGLKPVENRTWKTAFRGDFLIHAGRKIDYRGIDFIKSLKIDIPNDFQLGGIIGSAKITNCVQSYESKWFFGPYGFLIKNAKPIEFIPLRGQLGFFNYSGFNL
jgi:hypothetical protein